MLHNYNIIHIIGRLYILVITDDCNLPFLCPSILLLPSTPIICVYFKRAFFENSELSKRPFSKSLLQFVFYMSDNIATDGVP